jgi:hypothetical protein
MIPGKAIMPALLPQFVCSLSYVFKMRNSHSLIRRSPHRDCLLFQSQLRPDAAHERNRVDGN